ncbi:MAG: FAD:protein FMN transferase [Emcibacter sp.]|nr:FAD:protein FMN transferase [Emcibacter sp.]
MVQRRRVIKLLAASLAVYMVPKRGLSEVIAHKSQVELYSWNGFALGADVSLQLYHDDGLKAKTIIQNAVNIIKSMESLFSLYQENSIICQLNQNGIIYNPPTEFMDLISISQKISKMTYGAFDITVQPLWQYYRSKFSQETNHDAMTFHEFKEVYDLVGYEGLHIHEDKIFFDKKDMAITLNGIAQGYVTDRVAEYLKSEGLTSVLVDMGEYRALGPRFDHAPWHIGLADPLRQGGLSDVVELTKGAIATSSYSGDIFDEKGAFHHLFDPRTGKSANLNMSVTVRTALATTADALSTAFFVLSKKDIEKCLKNISDTEVRLTDGSGAVIML